MQQVSPIYILSYFFANIATSERKNEVYFSFFKASAGYIRAERKSATSEQKNEVYFGFFTASAGYIRAKRKSVTSERKNEVYFGFFTASAGYIRAKRKSATSERKISCLLEYFLQRQREISVACDDGTFMFPKECGLPPQRLYSREAQISNKRAKKNEFFFLQGRRLYLDYTSTITKQIQQKTIAHRTKSPIFTTKNKKKYKFIGDSK